MPIQPARHTPRRAYAHTTRQAYAAQGICPYNPPGIRRAGHMPIQPARHTPRRAYAHTTRQAYAAGHDATRHLHAATRHLYKCCDAKCKAHGTRRAAVPHDATRQLQHGAYWLSAANTALCTLAHCVRCKWCGTSAANYRGLTWHTLNLLSTLLLLPLR
jgi:hypothetical protein